VQPLEQLGREVHVLEGRRRLVHRAARGHLESTKTPNQATDIGAGGGGRAEQERVRLGFGSRRSHRAEAGPRRRCRLRRPAR
jgi:hypothetical protein